MAEKTKPGREPSEGKPQAPDLEQSPLDASGFQKAVSDGLQAYVRALKEIYNKTLKKTEELYQEYLKSQREQQIVADESLKEDYRTYVGSMQQAWGQENAQMRMEEANRTFLLAISDRQSDLRKNLEELYRNYIDTVQKQIAQTQQDYQAGYQDFLKGFQGSWANADVSRLDTNTLASIGQILIAASNAAGQPIAVK